MVQTFSDLSMPNRTHFVCTLSFVRLTWLRDLFLCRKLQASQWDTDNFFIGNGLFRLQDFFEKYMIVLTVGLNLVVDSTKSKFVIES